MRTVIRSAALAAACLGAAPALAADPAPASTTTTTTTTATATTPVKLKLDAIAELKASRGKLETTYTSVKGAAKGRPEWREGVILLSAADFARDKADAAAYKKLATEANTRFDLAKTLAAGGTGTSPGLAALKADPALGKYINLSEPITPATESLTATPDTWSKQGFSPETF